MRDYIVIFVNGQRHEIRGEQVFQPVSTWLRDALGLTGTKVVCAEGDCGSCTVLIGRPTKDTLQYRTACACIQYVFQLDATHLISIEGLLYDGELNPIQESMVACHGAQCGFCTPGVVMSLYSLFDQQPSADDHELRRGLVGNLCRCTGYEPILRAGLNADRSELRPLVDLFQTQAIARELKTRECEPVSVTWRDQEVYQPVSVPAAVAFRADHPDCLTVAGGTDLGVQVNKGQREFKTVLSLRALTDLYEIGHDDREIALGACVSIAELERVTQPLLPEFSEMLTRFGSPPIKNSGTLGGNIANGSPIGDSMPALFVLNAQIELTGPRQSRQFNMNDFYTGYRQSVMRQDELITRVRIPLPAQCDIFQVYKVSKRRDLDISSFTAAVWLRRNGTAIDDVRIAYGGVGPTILRLPRTEALLRGKTPTCSLFRQAGVVARTEIQPISDVRGAADFRLQLAENIPHKLYHQMCGVD